jgi:N-acetylmuramoyl-L-alanine amidase
MTTGTLGDSIVREFKVTRNPPPVPLPHDTLMIDEQSVEPSQAMWLGADDILNVRFKGSPGWEASFDIPNVESGIPMREIPPTETNGMTGIYVGQYRIQPSDRADQVQLVLQLRESFWSKEKILSRARITIMPDQFPIVGEIGGKRPFMNAGLGSDRLGGAKLGFIQPGVQFIVTGRVGEYYRAQLSEDMLAWIPADSVRFLPKDTPLPRSLAGSISATGNDVLDVVTLSLSKRLPYTSEQYLSPNVIAVDVYGATSNTNWITHHLSAKGIASVRWMQVSADRYRLLITLKHASQWGYDVDYVGTALRVRVRRPPVIASMDSVLNGMTIVLDAGHGGDNAGAIGATGAREMNANMSIVRHLERILLERGARPVLTRTEDQGPSMSDRIETILNANATLLISVHCNAGGDNSDPLAVRGTSTYYRHVGFKPLADTVYARLLELGLKELNAPTQLPNVLVETAFFSHPEDEILLLEDGFRQNVAERVVAGVEAFLRTAP